MAGDRTRGPSDSYGQACPIAAGLDVVGDRWTLLLVRDLAHAPLRFRDLQTVNPRISPNLLTKRLRHLEAAGIVRRRLLPPPASATVYELTAESREALLPVLNALARFGAHLMHRSEPGGAVELLVEQLRRNGTWVLAKGVDFSGEFVLELGDVPVGLTVGPATFEPSTRLPDHPTATVSLDGDTMPRLACGDLTLRDAEAAGSLRISGDRELAIELIDRLSLVDVHAG